MARRLMTLSMTSRNYHVILLISFISP